MTTLANLPDPLPLAACATREDFDTRATCPSCPTCDTIDTIDVASCQAAAHATRLAIARWRQGLAPSAMQVATALRASAQERWYAHTLTEFDAWRASGGFGQDGGHEAPHKADAQ
jgi:hypothetical protein